MADHADAPGTVPVVDRRPVPRGVLPRGVQTWLMAGLAIVMLFVIFLTGKPDGPAAPRQAASTAPPSVDRVRDYQERLRLLDDQAAREAREAALAAVAPPAAPASESGSAPQVDPLVAERKRRDYESLFATNVVLSRRPEGQRPDAGQRSPAQAATPPASAEPSIDEVADAVVRASARTAGAVASLQTASGSPASHAQSQE